MKSLRVTFLLHILIDPFWSYWQSGGSEVAVPVSVVSSESEVYEVEIDQLRELQLLQSVANPCFSCLLELLNIAFIIRCPPLVISPISYCHLYKYAEVHLCTWKKLWHLFVKKKNTKNWNILQSNTLSGFGMCGNVAMPILL